jgi:hypothetical protein
LHDICNGIEEQGGRCSHVSFAFDSTFKENIVGNVKVGGFVGARGYLSICYSCLSLK